MTSAAVERDERTVALENSGYRWSYLVLSFGLLLSVAYRSFARGETSWDLFALVLVGGAVNAVYQATHHVLYRRWAVLSTLAILVGAALAAMLVVFRH